MEKTLSLSDNLPVGAIALVPGVGTNASEDSMQIHVGRKHCEQYECGLCQHETKTREDLETHLKTCEIYICSRCEIRETTLAKIKEHMQEICEATPYTVLSHRKLHRDDQDELSHRQYFFRDV